jgi:hypothetical protein
LPETPSVKFDSETEPVVPEQVIVVVNASAGPDHPRESRAATRIAAIAPTLALLMQHWMRAEKRPDRPANMLAIPEKMLGRADGVWRPGPQPDLD